MGFSLLLAAVKGLRKKKKKVSSKAFEFKGIKRRRVIVKPNSQFSGIETISDDLLMAILRRLPAKDVIRSMCVSNLWYSLIASSHFTNLFFASSSKPMRFVVSLVGLVGEQKLSKHAFLTSSLPHDDQTDISVLDQDLGLSEMAGYIVNALRGLLCVRLDREVQICNLTTHQRVALPIIWSELLDEPKNDIWTSFGYDPVHDEYKVFNIVSVVNKKDKTVSSEHQVLVLGPQASWRNTKGQTCPHRPYSRGIFIKDVLYYGVVLDENKCAIMSFDFTSEEFKLIELPVETRKIPHIICGNVMNYKGKIAVYEYSRFKPCPSKSIDFWVMEDANKMEWSKHTMIIPLYQMDFDDGGRLWMQGKSSCSEVLLGRTVPALQVPVSYFYYNFEKNKITKRFQIRVPHCFRRDVWQTTFWEDNIENIMYLEI